MVWIGRFLFFTLILSCVLTFSVYFQGVKKTKGSQIVSQRDQKLPTSTSCLNREEIGEGIFGSSSQRLKKKLRSAIVFLGINDRPDYQNPVLHFSFDAKAQLFVSDSSYPLSILLDEIDGQDYTFKVLEKDKQAHFEIFSGAQPLFNFSVPQSKITREIFLDGFKLDSYVLVRQKATWLGQDQFLKDFGGEEYAFAQGSERLDFTHLSLPYSVFVKPSNLLAWKLGRWQEAEKDSKLYPLLKIEQIQNQTMKITIWDPTGLYKENILLTQSGAPSPPASLLPLKFIGAKSSHKWLLKFNKERLSVEPGDWLIHLGHKWEKVSSLATIEQYVQKLNVGELFVIEELKEDDGKKCLTGKLYSSSRVQKQDYKIKLDREAKK